MRREVIVGVFFLLILVGSVFGVYQFYFKQQLEQYAQDQLLLDQLEQKYDEIENIFGGTKPEAVIDGVKARVSPWVEAVNQRASYFNMGDLRAREPIPEGQLSPKLYYMRRAPEVIAAYRGYLRDKGMAEYVAPNELFEAPDPETIGALSPDENEVQDWLFKMHYGHSLVKLFVDANVRDLRVLSLWPQRPERRGLLNAFTVGVDVEMGLEDLLNFLDQKRFDRDRYYDVDAIRITNPYLRGNTGNFVQVQLLLTMTQFNDVPIAVEPKPGSGDVTTMFSGFGGRDEDDDDRVAPRRSLMDRLVRLFPF